jgi:hypothetical protein
MPHDLQDGIIGHQRYLKGLSKSHEQEESHFLLSSHDHGPRLESRASSSVDRRASSCFRRVGFATAAAAAETRRTMCSCIVSSLDFVQGLICTAHRVDFVSQRTRL